MEGTDAMDVDVPSPKISEEYRFVSDVYNRKKLALMETIFIVLVKAKKEVPVKIFLMYFKHKHRQS